MIVEMGKPYRTRGGKRDVRILCTDAGGYYPVLALVGKHERMFTYTLEGKHSKLLGRCDLDLVEVTEPEMPKIFAFTPELEEKFRNDMKQIGYNDEYIEREINIMKKYSS